MRTLDFRKMNTKQKQAYAKWERAGDALHRANRRLASIRIVRENLVNTNVEELPEKEEIGAATREERAKALRAWLKAYKADKATTQLCKELGVIR